MQQLRIIIYVYFLSSVYVGSGRGATLLPYGPSNPADSVLLLDDDETVELPTLTEAFQFYGTSYTSIWVSIYHYVDTPSMKLLIALYYNSINGK